MLFQSNEYKAKSNLQMIKIVTEQYLRNELSDKDFKELCLVEIQRIIDRKVESEGCMAQLDYTFTKIYEKWVKSIKRLTDWWD